MTRAERDKTIRILQWLHGNNFLFRSTEEDVKFATEYAIKALEQEQCEDEEYEKDLNELKEQIFKEGNTLISKQDLLERFVEIDNEYKNSHWNLLQILANIDILIGKEPCEDAVRRKAVIDTLDEMDKVLNEDRTVERYIDLLKECYTVLPSVNPQKAGHWIYDRTRDWDGECKYECSECGMGSDVDYAYCMRCGAKMVESQECEVRNEASD